MRLLGRVWLDPTYLNDEIETIASLLTLQHWFLSLLLSRKEFLQLSERLSIYLGLHRTEFWPTHGAEFRRFVDVGWEGFVVVFAGAIGIKG